VQQRGEYKDQGQNYPGVGRIRAVQWLKGHQLKFYSKETSCLGILHGAYGILPRVLVVLNSDPLMLV